MQTGTSTTFLKIAVTETERRAVINLLQDQQLPVSDIDGDKLLYAFMQGDKLIGTAGLEIFDDCALLRSVSIEKNEQGRGFGLQLNEQLEQYARDSGIICLYLLTTTANDFFEKQGYCVINRNDVPEAIKQTAEFVSLCPSSAIVMKKEI
jgi:amino-acid N-acetyltransferase